MSVQPAAAPAYEMPEGMTGAPWFTPADATECGAPRNAVSLARRAAKAGWATILECEGLNGPTEARVWRVIASALLRADDGRDVFGLSTVTAEWHGRTYASGTRTFNGKQIASPLLLAAVRDAFTVHSVEVVDREAERSAATYRGLDLEHWISVGEQQAERAWAATWRADEVKDECASTRQRNGITVGPLVQPEVDAMMSGQWDPAEVAARSAHVPLWVDVAEPAVYTHCRTAVRIARHAESAIGRIQVLAWEAEGYQERQGTAPRWAPSAQDAWEHAQRARILADRTEATADAARAARMAAEAESECAPAVAVEFGRLRERDAQRASKRPDDTADAYAQQMRGMFDEPRRGWVQWERENRRPAETLGEAYDRYALITKGGWTSAELEAGEVNRHDRNRALFALGIAAAQCTEHPEGWDASRCTVLRDAAEHGQSLYARGARPGKGKRGKAAAHVWRMLVTADRWGSGFDFMRTDRDIARLDAAGWAGTAAHAEADALRRALLVEHGLNVRTTRMTDIKRQWDARDAQRSGQVADAHHAAKVEALKAGADAETALAAGHRAGAPVRKAMNAEYAAGEAAWVATLEEGERVTGTHMVLLGTYWRERAHAARLAAEDATRHTQAGDATAGTDH